MLHGHAQTGEEMAKKAGALRSEVKKIAEFVIVESPIRNPAGEQTWYEYERISEDESKYTGVDKAVEEISTIFKEQGPFDGVWGFSMGGMMTGVLAQALSDNDVAPEVNFSFSIIFAGPFPKDPKCVLNGGIEMPSFHCFGENDKIIPEYMSKRLSECYKEPTIVTHEGGHLMPSVAPVRKALKVFLVEQRQRIVVDA